MSVPRGFNGLVGNEVAMLLLVSSMVNRRQKQKIVWRAGWKVTFVQSDI
jgi:hypothetical protein